MEVGALDWCGEGGGGLGRWGGGELVCMETGVLGRWG